MARITNRATGDAFWSGLAGCALAIVPVFAVDGLVSVLSIGDASFVGVLPLVIAHALGFAAGSIIRSRVISKS